MSEEMKNGKKPLSKKTTKPLNPDDVYGNPLDIPADIKAELDKQGLIGKWISQVRLNKNGGIHDKRWMPYKRKKSDTINSSDFLNGTDPEGVVRRGDLILGVKTKQQAEMEKEYIRQRNERNRSFNKQAADQLRTHARANRLNATVYEGYEDNE